MERSYVHDLNVINLKNASFQQSLLNEDAFHILRNTD